MSIGKTTQIMGPVVDVLFESGELPEIYSALEITLEDNSTLVCEVQQHLGENTVRSISMGPTEGLARGMDAKSTGKPIQAPVGREVLGRIINVTGEAVDEMGPINNKEFLPIHREPPAFEEQETKAEMLVTGIKVLDLLWVALSLC